MTQAYDVCVIGAGGVVGSAILRRIAPHARVIGLEKHAGPAREASGANSHVIHSGFHEIPGTLKSQLAPRGSEMLRAYAQHRGVPLLPCGMLIAIPGAFDAAGMWGDAGALWRLWRGGRRQRVNFRWVIGRNAIKAIASIQAAAGIFIPSVAVVDVHALIAAFQEDAVLNGAQIIYSAAVRDIQIDRDGAFLVTAGTAEYRALTLINSAGRHAADISRIAGGAVFPLELIRGEYYEVRGGMEKWNIRTLVYPVMPARSKSKGIHLGPRTDGRLFLGPSAAPTSDPPAHKDIFLAAARKFLPDIQPDDLSWSHEGVRPKYLRRDGVSDFLIRVERRRPMLINLVGIDSPGLSSCMAIAEYVADLLKSEIDERQIAV